MKEKEYLSEEQFLKEYDSSIYEKLSMTVDIMIMSVSTEDTDNYRKLNEKKFSVLLIKRETYPFKEKWCLPGGFIKMDENLDEAAKRVLKNETNLKNIYLEQLYTFSDVKRDPRMRIVSTSYIALIDKKMLDEKLPKNASWFNVIINEDENNYYIKLENGIETIDFSVEKSLRHQTTDRYDFKVKENTKLAFDHPLVIVSGIERLRNKLEYTDIAFNMMPEYFTLGELQQVYETILNKKLIIPDFRRKIMNKVIKTDKIKKGEGHRPSALYKFNSNKNRRI